MVSLFLGLGELRAVYAVVSLQLDAEPNVSD